MNTREERITDEQKNIMLEFMEQHSDFAKGKLLEVEGRKTSASLWEVLSQALNSVAGPKKASAKWARVWIDLKNKVKRKAADIKNSRIKTGGGCGTLTRLSMFEEILISFLTEEAVYGLKDINGGQFDTEAAEPVTKDCETELGNMSSDTNVTLTPTIEVVDTTQKIQKSISGKKLLREAMQNFSNIGTDLNTKIDGVNEKLDKLNSNMSGIAEILHQMLQERKETNKHLSRIATVLENKQ